MSKPEHERIMSDDAHLPTPAHLCWYVLYSMVDVFFRAA